MGFLLLYHLIHVREINRIESPKKHVSIIGEDGVNFLLEHMKKMVSGN